MDGVKEDVMEGVMEGITTPAYDFVPVCERCKAVAVTMPCYVYQGIPGKTNRQSAIIISLFIFLKRNPETLQNYPGCQQQYGKIFYRFIARCLIVHLSGLYVTLTVFCSSMHNRNMRYTII